MPTINLTLPVAGQGITAGLHATNYAALQALLNGGLDEANLDTTGTPSATTFLRGDMAWAAVGGELGYTAYTASVSVAATTEAGANTIVTAPAIAFDGSTVAVIEFFAPRARSSASSTISFFLYDGAASIGTLGSLDIPTAGNGPPVMLAHRLTPAAATKTYSIRAAVTSGTGTILAGAGGLGNNMPGFIRVFRA